MMSTRRCCRSRSFLVRRVSQMFLVLSFVLSGSNDCLAQTMSADTQSDHRLFAPNAWPKSTGAPVNSSPVLGDLDGDGILEIIVGSDNGKVYVWKPDGTLMPGWPVATGDSIRSSPALADIDGDGRLDVIVGSFDNKVYVWNFNGSLLAGWPVVTGSVVYSSPAVGDIDGDQRPEVVVGSFDNKVYAWNADGTLVREWPKPTGLFVYSSPALADIDGDGLVEVIVGTDNNRVFAWNGDGTEVEGWPTATEHVVPSSPAIGDIDNDGVLEVVVGSWDKLFVWNARGEQKKGWPVTAGHQIPSSPALADLNNDGSLDIIVGCKDGKVYAWDAGGQPLPGWPTVTDAEISSSPAVGDLDGDGRLDVIVGSKDSKIYVWDAEGRLLPGWPKNTGDAISSSPAIGDVDGDGTLELVIGSKDHHVYAWSFPRTGAFTPRIAWQNFHGDPSHTGLYGFQTIAVARTAEPQQRPSFPSQGEIIPVRPSEGQLPDLSTGPQQPVIPREIKDGYVSDLVISDYDTTQITLTWTSPSGIRTSQTAYDIRYSTEAITEETWNKAAPYPEILRPAPAGAREVYALTNLPPSDMYIALRVVEGQKSFPLSNVVRLERLDTTPPAGIQGLQVTELNDNLLELSWQTTGDDGMVGTAKTYDIRYAEVPLDELTWLRAAQVENEPAPLPAGMEQTFQIQKPWHDREIFFGIKAIDESLNISVLSNIAAWSPRDEIPPSRIVDLRVTRISGTNVTISWTAPGNNLNIGKADHYDIRYSDYPITEETWEMARLADNPPIPENSGTPQTYILQGIPIGAEGYIGIKAVDSSGNVAALSNVVKTAMDDLVPPAAVTDLKAEQIGKDWVQVSWTATGDDKQDGAASAYVLRYGGDLRVVESWMTALDVQLLPVPSLAGTTETATISGLHENTTYFIGLRVLDEQGNSSETSNILRVKTFSHSTPEAVTDLAIEELTPGSVALNWTAPQDFGEETPNVSGYDLRYALSEITEANWDSATKVPSPPKPSAPGTLESFVVKGAPQDSAYYIALKSVDALGNPSGLSNVLQIPKMDKVAPGPIIDLFVEETGLDWAKLSWTAPGDDKQEGQASAYFIRVAPTLQLLKQWEQATEIPTPELSPSTAGKKEDFTITGLKSNSIFFIAVKTADEFGNVSELSNIVRAKTKDSEAPAAITDLQIADILEDAVILEWTASGEDGMEGQAKAYDIRYSQDPITEENWESAQMVSLVPRPSEAGTLETVKVTDLYPNTLYYFAVIAVDSSGNASPLSNVVDVLTIDTISPPMITTLRAEKVKDNAVLLTWLSPGDDEFRDMPERYEIRYREGQETPLNETTWPQSSQVDEPPIPSGKGDEEQFLLSGLAQDSFYSIGIKAFDEYGNASDISNIVQVFTSVDSVTDLAILDFSGQSVTLTWTTPGGEISGGDRRYDIRYATTALTEENWENASPAKTLLPQELVVKAPEDTEKIELTGLPPYEQLFFAVKVVPQNAERQPSGLSNVVELNRIDIIPPGEVANLQVTDSGEERDGLRSLELTWNAPGDNELEGTASKYDIRYGTIPPTEENWDTLIPVTEVPEPLSAGTPQQTTVQITPGEDTLYFAVKAFDEAFNASGLSNIAQWSPEDFVSPAAVMDLAAERVSGGDITIAWTAPGDNEDRGIAAFYDIRYSTEEDDVKKWDQAMVVSEEPLPEIAGTRQEYMITGLQQDTLYYIAMKTTDDARNTSALSNIVAVRTTDEIPPAPIADLRVGKSGNDWVELQWTASGDDGNSGRATSYSLRYATRLKDLEDWENAYELTGVPVPKNPGDREKFTVKNLQPNTNYYFGIRALDNGGNLAELSNVAESLTADGESSEPINTLVFVGGAETSVTLSWNAPLDRGPTERLARYEIRYAEDREALEQWNRAKKVKHALVPGEPGTIESVVIDNLSPNQRYYVAIKAIDQQGNISEMSNIAVAYTTDTIPPKPVTDLTVLATTEHSVSLSWTVTEDDLAHETPEVYEIRYSFGLITEMNWDRAEVVVPPGIQALQPSVPGSQMNYSVTGLAENTTYYLGIRSIDTSGNVSPLSNIVVARTNDVTPPQSIADLQAVFPTSNSIMLSWTSPSDEATGPSTIKADLAEGGTTESRAIPSTSLRTGAEELQIGGYDIRYSTTPPGDGVLDGQTWETAEKVLLPPEPQVPGVIEEFVVHNLEPGKTYYFAMKAIDRSGNVSAISNTVLEATLPAEWEAMTAMSPATDTPLPPSKGEYSWEIQQGNEIGEIGKDSSGVFRIDQKPGYQGESSPEGGRGVSPITALYPQSNKALLIRQSELVFQMKSTQRFALYMKVQTETGEHYYLGYTTDFGITGRDRAIVERETQTSVPTARPRKRIENYVFFPLDPVLLDNEWHEIRLNLAQDLFEGTGQAYEGTVRLSLRGNDLSFRGMTMQGPVFTKVADFEDRRNPLEAGWNIHFGSGTVQVVRESALTPPYPPSRGESKGGVPQGGMPSEGIGIEGIAVGAKQDNAFLSVKAESHRGIVLTYPKDGIGRLSDKPFFLANVRAIGEFKVILKVHTMDDREYYLAYLPAADLQQAVPSGNYIYVPLHAEFDEGGISSGTWLQIQANIEQDLRNNQLNYAYTSWISFHGKEFSIDNVHFSTAVLETVIE